MRNLLLVSALALAACNQNSNDPKNLTLQSNTGASNAATGRQLGPELIAAIGQGFKLFECNGKAKHTRSFDGIRATPEDNPDRIEEHNLSMMFRIKFGATPPFDLFNAETGEWDQICATNCGVMGTAAHFTVSKAIQSRFQVPGDAKGETDFEYSEPTAGMHVSMAAMLDTGISRDQTDFTGQCHRIEGISDLSLHSYYPKERAGSIETR